MNFTKLVIAFLLSALLAYAIGIYTTLPWYSFVFTNALVAIVIPQSSIKSFLTGGLGVGLLWLFLAVLINNDNNAILSIKVAQILPLKGSVKALFILTFFVGFLVGGMASLSASYIRQEKK